MKKMLGNSTCLFSKDGFTFCCRFSLLMEVKVTFNNFTNQIYYLIFCREVLAEAAARRLVMVRETKFQVVYQMFSKCMLTKKFI